MRTDMTFVGDKHFSVLPSDPAHVTPGDSFDGPGDHRVIPKSEIDEYVLAIGIELLNIFPAFRAKLSDIAPCQERVMAVSARENEKRFPSQVYQNHQFEILDIIFWRDIQVPHKMLKQNG